MDLNLDTTGVGSVAKLLDDGLNAIWPNKTAEEQAKLTALMAQINGQLAINQAEAANPHIWVSGWRPYIGWVGGSSLAWQHLLCPMLTWLLQICGVHVPPPPILDGAMDNVVMSLLGLGIVGRTVEKVTGKAGRGL